MRIMFSIFCTMFFATLAANFAADLILEDPSGHWTYLKLLGGFGVGWFSAECFRRIFEPKEEEDPRD